MPISNVNQEPANLQELLLVKSMPILAKMLGPSIEGNVVNNYNILDVEEVNGETFVLIERTKDPLVNVDTATAAQKVQVRIPYNRHSIKSVLQHYIGNGPYVMDTLPATIADFNAWLAAYDIDLTLDADEIYYSAYETTPGVNLITIRPTDPKDLKWKGVFHMTVRIDENAVPPGPTFDDVTYNLDVENPVTAEPDDIIELVATIPDGYDFTGTGWTLSPTGVPAGLTLNAVGETSAELILDAVAVGDYPIAVTYTGEETGGVERTKVFNFTLSVSESVGV